MAKVSHVYASEIIALLREIPRKVGISAAILSIAMNEQNDAFSLALLSS
jgi:hypothetical protein